MERSELESLVAQIIAQEAELRFPTFSNTQAIALGAAIAEKARSRSLAVTVDIRRAGQQIFHCALDGTSPDNDQWAIRKARVVERLGHSSFLVGIRLYRCQRVQVGIRVDTRARHEGEDCIVVVPDQKFIGQSPQAREALILVDDAPAAVEQQNAVCGCLQRRTQARGGVGKFILGVTP